MMQTRKMTWDCDKGGPGKNCFNRKRRPKFGAFDGCFPRDGNFTDVDGIIELSNKFCFLEWKEEGASVPVGQRLLYERLTRNTESTVFIVYGNAEYMTVKSFGYYRGGIYHNAVSRTINDLRRWLKRWANWAEKV